MTTQILERNQTVGWTQWIDGLTRIYNMTEGQKKLVDPKLVEEARIHFAFIDRYKLVD